MTVQGASPVIVWAACNINIIKQTNACLRFTLPAVAGTLCNQAKETKYPTFRRNSAFFLLQRASVNSRCSLGLRVLAFSVSNQSSKARFLHSELEIWHQQRSCGLLCEGKPSHDFVSYSAGCREEGGGEGGDQVAGWRKG